MRPIPVPTPPALEAIRARIDQIKSRFRASPNRFQHLVTAAAERSLTTSVEKAITSAAARYGIDRPVLQALAQVESGFRSNALSPSGAMGIMQLMPATAHALGVTDPMDPEANIDAGARYLREQMDRFGGDLALALAAYNAGPSAVARYGGVPPYQETQRFVARVLEHIGSAR